MVRGPAGSEAPGRELTTVSRTMPQHPSTPGARQPATRRSSPPLLPHIGTLLLASLYGCAAPASAPTPAPEILLYVAPGGSDAAPGSEARPFATIGRARDEIRVLLRDGAADRPITVLLRGGRYDLREPIVFSPEDSGTRERPITYAAYPGEEPVLSGGRPITGWERRPNGVWTTVLPEVRSGEWRFRQLYVNGELRRRARTPNEGFFRVAGQPCGGRRVHYHDDCDRFQFAPGDIDPRWSNLEDVEVIVYHFWTDSHLPIREIDTDSNVVVFRHKAGKQFTDDFTDGGARYVVENLYEGLDQPGEWYLDRRTGLLSYLPMPGEEMARAEVIAPVIPEFIRIEGRPSERRFVEHLTFRGLAFRYTNWELPPGNSNDRQGSSSVPAAITLTGARHVAFDDNALSNLGTFAFEVRNGSSHNRFTANELTDIAAGGFRINGGTDEDHPLERTGSNLIADNRIRRYGVVYPSAVGVLLMNTDGNTVAHNEISHGYYTAVSLGWEWGYQRSVSRDNVVEYNHIHHIGQGLLSDMGGIYTLGVSPGTVIRNNLIHDIDANRYGGWGIYNDEGSTHILIEKNIVHSTKFAGYDIHFAREITVRNNIFALGRLDQLSRTRQEPHKSVFFENNIVYWTGGELLHGNWEDRTYDFYFHPKDATGTRPVDSTFDMDWNLYFNPTLPADSVRFGKDTFAGWRARGKDVHSIYADPLFVDPARFDFRLRPESPAFALGFQPIDMSRVGPRSPGGATPLAPE